MLKVLRVCIFYCIFRKFRGRPFRRGPPRRSFLQRGPNKLVKGISCLRTKLYAKFHSDIVDELRYITQLPYDNNSGKTPPSYNFDQEKLEINSLDDCIDGIEEPLYGIRVRVKLLDDQPCILEDTCKEGLMEDTDSEGKFRRKK